MHVSFIPQRRDDTITVARQGGTLTINGDAFDFSTLPDGATLPATAITSNWIVGAVARLDGVLHITLRWPYQKAGRIDAPDPIESPPDGLIVLPTLMVDNDDD
ncbi:MAG TPA: hypothetical protein VNS12_13640 [Pelagibacterium sp.]|uniref:hypothetical protein n=1 Tax=Pelagibacterium sp. TaxID=1967288 RepID=UPI002C97B8A4|nr:hypothetical protein [Pelagibacterium sp.]HWJ89105.1 hypothetical protein [Pelagibacterium sp.]